jgi:subtilase family serine protease
MSATNFSKKLFTLLNPTLLCLLSLPAQADPLKMSLIAPPAPPRPPYHKVENTPDVSSPGGISPAQIRQYYGFPANYLGAGEIIAIIDSGDDPNIEADLNVFSAQYGLPACTTANGCFTKLFSDGTQPAGDAGWAVETSLDVEWAHAIAPLAKIYLIESADAYSLYNALAYVAQLKPKPSVVSMSWGGGEFNGEQGYDSFYFQTLGIPAFAAAGDSGEGVWYPAASPYVTGVGGTQVTMDASGNYLSETAWSGSGGGISAYETEPAFQVSYVIPQAKGMRGVPDVTYNGSGGSAFAVYDSYGEGGWLQVAGTSAGTPQWAALAAIMMSAKKGYFGNFNGSLYSVARTGALFHDISTGTNGSCGYICTARSGFDYVSGVGSPQASNLINRFM